MAGKYPSARISHGLTNEELASLDLTPMDIVRAERLDAVQTFHTDRSTDQVWICPNCSHPNCGCGSSCTACHKVLAINFG